MSLYTKFYLHYGTYKLDSNRSSNPVNSSPVNRRIKCDFYGFAQKYVFYSALSCTYSSNQKVFRNDGWT